MQSVFITNGQLRKALAATRSLGKKGIRVTVSEETKLNISGFSKFCKRSLKSPNAKKRPEKYYHWLLEELKKNPSDVLLPMDDDTIQVVLKYREQLQKVVQIPLVSSETLELVSDKGKATKLAMEAGLECPKTVFPENLLEVESLTSTMNYPLIIKPRKSSGSRGISIVHKKEDLKKTYERIHKDYPFPIIQECIGLGARYDVCLLFDSNQEVKASFVQKELRHFPIKMGPSTVQESVDYPELIRQCVPLMKKLNWYGIVELEFMIDSNTGKLMFMEINPRFWNSLALSIMAGVDFPWLLYRLAKNEEIEEKNFYESGIKCRWLLPGDILHFILNKERGKMNPPFISGKKSRLYDDILSKEDPLPTMGFILACFRYVFDFSMWKFFLKR